MAPRRLDNRYSDVYPPPSPRTRRAPPVCKTERALGTTAEPLGALSTARSVARLREKRARVRRRREHRAGAVETSGRWNRRPETIRAAAGRLHEGDQEGPERSARSASDHSETPEQQIRARSLGLRSVSSRGRRDPNAAASRLLLALWTRFRYSGQIPRIGSRSVPDIMRGRVSSPGRRAYAAEYDAAVPADRQRAEMVATRRDSEVRTASQATARERVRRFSNP